MKSHWLARVPVEVIVLVVTTIFMAGSAYKGSDSQADVIKTLQEHDTQYGQDIAAIRVRVDDLVDYFHIPKRQPPNSLIRTYENQ